MSFRSQRAEDPQLPGPRPEPELCGAWNAWRGAEGGTGKSPQGPLCGEQPVGGTWHGHPGAPPPKCGSSLQVPAGEVGLPAHPGSWQGVGPGPGLCQGPTCLPGPSALRLRALRQL